MRDYTNIDKYLDKLIEDVYPQPEDSGHTSLAGEFIDTIMEKAPEVESVLDVGCGEGFCQDIFGNYSIEYTGVALGEDVQIAKSKNRKVDEYDFSFLPYPDHSFDLIFSRHSLEHSPFPLLTLMEWGRITRRYLAVVVPNPGYWQYHGRNHYFMLYDAQWKAIFEKAGFSLIYSGEKREQMYPLPRPMSKIEFWFLLEKV